MKNDQTYMTSQENFWAGDFGTEYIARNRGHALLASNLYFFSKALKQVGTVGSALELGTNVGMNLQALKLLYPNIELKGVEINPEAAAQASQLIGESNMFIGSIFDFDVSGKVDLAFTKGVLIHIEPKLLKRAYSKLYESSLRYVLVAEYYNPSPIELSYRGHSDKLFKRDFAGEMLDQYPELKLVDYGFSYRRDPAFPQDDITWFLLEK